MNFGHFFGIWDHSVAIRRKPRVSGFLYARRMSRRVFRKRRASDAAREKGGARARAVNKARGRAIWLLLPPRVSRRLFRTPRGIICARAHDRRKFKCPPPPGPFFRRPELSGSRGGGGAMHLYRLLKTRRGSGRRSRDYRGTARGLNSRRRDCKFRRD